MFRSIRTKIMMLQVGLVLAVTISLGIASYVLTHSSLKESQKENMQYVTEHIKLQISEDIYHRELLLERIAHSDEIMGYFKDQQETLIDAYFERCANEFDYISWVNDKGQEKLKMIKGKSSNSFKNLNNSPVFRLAINNPNKTVSAYNPFSPEINGACIEFGICEKDALGNITGYISAAVSISQVSNSLEDFRQNNKNSALLIDSERTILACKNNDLLSYKLEITGREAEKILTELKISRLGYARANIMGADSYISYAPVLNEKLSLIVILPYKYFALKLSALRNTVILVGLTILILGFLLSMLVASDITNPVMKLLKTTANVAKGDFTQRVSIDANDEMGRLSAAFNQMIENLQKTTTSMVNLNKEIVERQKAENAQQSLNEKLEKTIKSLTLANRELADFAHVAAHDLKAPLRAIGSLAGIMLADYGSKLDEQAVFYLNTLVKRTERMSELISGILTYSEIGHSTSIIPVNINEVIRHVLANLQIPPNINVILETDFPIVYCGKTHMQQVFTELLRNAIKYMDKPNGYIRLKCYYKQDYWLFSVSDNGRGIEEKYHDKIFKIFQTLVRRDEEESTGIGLSVVKRIIEKYNGKIWVESQPKVGSTFFFTLRKEKTEVNNEKLQTNSVS